MMLQEEYAYQDLGVGGIQWDLVAGGEGFGGGSDECRLVLCLLEFYLGLAHLKYNSTLGYVICMRIYSA
jgi:hypothetical protein